VKISTVLTMVAIFIFARPAFSQMQKLGPKESFSAARLSPAEAHEIITAVEDSAFDTPDSWSEELLIRRVRLGDVDGMVVQGSKLLCGATGNCQTWVLRRVDGKWASLFPPGDQAPIVDKFQLGPGATGGIKDLCVESNSSADAEVRVKYKFDGKFYRPRS